MRALAQTVLALTALLAFVSFFYTLSAPHAAASAVVVNLTIDEVDVNLDDDVCDVDAVTEGEQCTLRAAIQQANATDGPANIQLPAGTYTLTIDGDEDASAKGDVDIRSEITIVGAGAGQTIVEAGLDAETAIDRVFHVRQDGELNLQDLQVRHGDSGVGRGGGIYNVAGALALNNVTVADNLAVDGAGLFNQAGTVEITNSIFSGNHAATDGGGIYNEAGTLTINDSDIQFNLAGVNGAGINSESNGAIVTINNSRITDNEVTAACCNGGGIVSEFGSTTLTIADSVITRNSAGANGGGIYTSGDTELTITDSLVTENVVGSNGGAIYTMGPVQLEIARSTIDGNEAGNVGGGLNLCCDGGTVSITGTTISNNNANGRGGGVFILLAAVILTNSTVSGNQSNQHGGGFYAEGPLTTNFVTITNNSADADDMGVPGDGGGIWTNSTTMLNSTILAANLDPTSDPDCFGSIGSSAGHNLVGLVSAGCNLTGVTTGNVVGLDPLLGPLAHNGGETQTHALQPDSPAIDAGQPACPPPAADQREVARPADGDEDQVAACDIGSFELSGAGGLVQGDNDCDGDVDAVDALQALRHIAGLGANQEPGCPALSGAVPAGAAPQLFGDIDCDGDVDAVDALQILRHLAGLPVNQEEGCPAIGESIG